MKKERNLKKEILIILISFSVFIAIAIGILSIINSYYSKLVIIEHNQKQTLFQVESEVNAFLEKIYNLSSYLKNNYSENTNLLKNIVDTNTNISSILVLDKNGIIEDFYAKTNLNIYKGFDYSKQDYFIEIKENKENYWSNVFLSSVDEEAAISYSFKANDKIIVLLVKLKEISDFISRLRNQDGSNMIKIFDNSGIIILNPNNPDLVLQRINQKREQVFTTLIDRQEPYSFAIYTSKFFEGKQYGTYTIIDKTEWKIVTRENYNLILKSLKNIVLGTVIIMILFILLAISLSLKISKRIFTSFDDLQKTTSDISNGNYDIEIKESYYSEFNKLLFSFNKMKIKIDKREDSLEASLNSFKSLFNSTMEMILIHDKGICIDANNVSLKFLGIKNKSELIGKDLMDFIAYKYRDIFKDNYYKNTKAFEFEIFVNQKKYICLGQSKFINLNNQRVKLSTLVNISELKAKDKLLFQQSKMAAIGEMIGNIAHQWRQPLSMISTCASGIKFEKELDQLSDERFFESLDMIVDNTQYLSKTIDDFRNFFMPDKNIEDFSISESIKQVLKLVKLNIENNNIDVNIQTEEELIIRGYSNEFLQVLINILNNSKDALVLKDEESRFIEITTYKKNKKCILEISDSGGGINEDIISDIFDPYFTTKHRAKGTGIGLYMSHQIIVQHMKGNIWAKNTEIKRNNKILNGTTIVIELPLEYEEY